MTKLPAIAAAWALAAGLAAAHAEPAVVGLARAYLGPQSTLDAIKSVHYTGTLERIDPDKPGKESIQGTLDMVFAKPSRQRVRIVGPKTTVVTVLDGYDAWDYFTDNAGVAQPRLIWLSAKDIRELRATAWENLYYYSAPPGGSVEDRGPATIDGVECERVDFTHSPGVVYQRYFDRDTGRLVLTVHGKDTIREAGVIVVDGVRFPKSIISTNAGVSGKNQISKATFDRITVDETLPGDFFTAPSVLPATAPAAAPTGK
jgi:hypothetical protein